MAKFLKFLVTLIIVLIIWEGCVRILQVDAYTLPAPSVIVATFFNDFNEYKVHLIPTIQLVILGLFCSVICGVVFAVVLRIFSFLHDFIYPFLIISQNIPVIVIAPLLVIWFGFGLLPKLIVITLVCFFPITVSLLEGFERTDRDLLKYMRMMGASKLQIFTKLEWPNAMPYFFNGLKIAGTYSVMGAIISEWIGSDAGLGKYMIISQRAFMVDRVFVAIIWIVIFALLIFLIILALQKLVMRWSND